MRICQMKISQNATVILDRLKTALELKNDSELATTLGIAPNTLSAWKKRNSVDFDKIFSICENISIDWLIKGEEHHTAPGFLHQKPISTELQTLLDLIQEYGSQKIIKQFTDKMLEIKKMHED